MAQTHAMARKKKLEAPTSGPAKAAKELHLPPEKLLPIRRLLKPDWRRIGQEKLNEILSLLWFPEGMEEEAKNARMIKAIDLFESIEPGDGIESMLAAQMVGAHHAAMECLRRAMLPNQTFEGRNAALSQAQRLMGLYTQQLAALDKHRGKGQQKITVERVTVQSGGQAIVGNVERGDASTSPAAGHGKVAPPQIEHAPQEADSLENLTKAPATRKTKAGRTHG